MILQDARRIQDWEARAGRAFSRLRNRGRSAADVCAAYARWLLKGRDEIGPNCPIKTVTGYAIWAFPEGDESAEARDLRQRYAFMEALTDITMKVHYTYMDEMLETRRGGAFYALEIDALALQYGVERGFDPAVAVEAMDFGVRTYLARAGRQVARRALISDAELTQSFRDGMAEITDGFVEHLAENDVRMDVVRMGRFPE